MNTSDIMTSARMAGDVIRYHGWPVREHQTIAHHTWNVMRLYVAVWGSPPVEVWEYMLHHDLGELSTGDVGHHVKANVPGLKALLDQGEEAGLRRLGLELPEIGEYERLRFKFCDHWDCVEHAEREMLMGNHLAAPITKNMEWAIYQLIGYMPLLDLNTVHAWVDEYNHRVSEFGERLLVKLDGVDRR